MLTLYVLNEKFNILRYLQQRELRVLIYFQDQGWNFVDVEFTKIVSKGKGKCKEKGITKQWNIRKLEEHHQNTIDYFWVS